VARTPATFYSTYRIVALVGFTVVVLILEATVATSPLTWGIEFIVVFLVVGTPVVLRIQYRVKRPVREDGSEFPRPTGGDGVTETEIAEDRSTGEWANSNVDETADHP